MKQVKKIKKNHIPYNERTDDEKLQSSWNKALKHYANKDFSAAVLRVATAAEIAANVYIRSFLQGEHHLPSEFVDELLRSANGMQGKFTRLIIPAAKSMATVDDVKVIRRHIETISNQRNAVAHSGEFKTNKDAKLVFMRALEVVRILAPRASEQLHLPGAG